MATSPADELREFRDFLNEQLKTGPAGLSPEESLRLFRTLRGELDGGQAAGSTGRTKAAAAVASAVAKSAAAKGADPNQADASTADAAQQVAADTKAGGGGKRLGKDDDQARTAHNQRRK